MRRRNYKIHLEYLINLRLNKFSQKTTKLFKVKAIFKYQKKTMTPKNA